MVSKDNMAWCRYELSRQGPAYRTSAECVRYLGDVWDQDEKMYSGAPYSDRLREMPLHVSRENRSAELGLYRYVTCNPREARGPDQDGREYLERCEELQLVPDPGYACAHGCFSHNPEIFSFIPANLREPFFEELRECESDRAEASRRMIERDMSARRKQIDEQASTFRLRSLYHLRRFSSNTNIYFVAGATLDLAYALKVGQTIQSPSERMKGGTTFSAGCLLLGSLRARLGVTDTAVRDYITKAFNWYSLEPRIPGEQMGKEWVAPKHKSRSLSEFINHARDLMTDLSRVSLLVAAEQQH